VTSRRRDPTAAAAKGGSGGGGDGTKERCSRRDSADQRVDARAAHKQRGAGVQCGRVSAAEREILQADVGAAHYSYAVPRRPLRAHSSRVLPA
ncbi:hypothetical protein GGH99_008291, partial [Coemansia sp. RSA 1285]